MTGNLTIVLYEDPEDTIPKIHVRSSKYMAWIAEMMLPSHLHVDKVNQIEPLKLATFNIFLHMFFSRTKLFSLINGGLLILQNLEFIILLILQKLQVLTKKTSSFQLKHQKLQGEKPERRKRQKERGMKKKQKHKQVIQKHQKVIIIHPRIKIIIFLIISKIIIKMKDLREKKQIMQHQIVSTLSQNNVKNKIIFQEMLRQKMNCQIISKQIIQTYILHIPTMVNFQKLIKIKILHIPNLMHLLIV